MKNFETILSDAGVELSDEQKKTVTKAIGENYKPVTDWEKEKTRADNLEEQLNTTKESLKKFDGVNLEDLNKQINDLKDNLSSAEAEYQEKIADRDFQDILKDSISAAHGRNTKAITALLDLDTLKASKNQKEDITAAIKVLTEAEDSKMLFGEPEAVEIGKGNPIGNVSGHGMTAEEKENADCRAAMGLPAVKTEGDK